MRRKIYYAIIHIPIDLIKHAMPIKEKKDPKKEHLIFSTDHTNPPDKPITEEDPFIQAWAKKNQKAVSLFLPIKETNKWTTLPEIYTIRIDLYFSPEKEESSQIS